MVPKPETDGVDELTLGTVNASMRRAVSVEELVAAFSDTCGTRDGRVDLALETFFIEVPLEAQVAFLSRHNIATSHALKLARSNGIADDIPLARAERW